MNRRVNFRSDTIVRIDTILGEKPSCGIFWRSKPKRYLFGLITRPAGLYEMNFMTPGASYLGDKPGNNMMVHNGELYYKPHLVAYQAKGSSAKVYFDSVDELKDQVEDLRNELTSETNFTWTEFNDM